MTAFERGNMSKKNVLIISEKKRKKGNSDILCHEFMRGAEESGHSVEMISLYDRDIRFCRACYACFETGRCVLKDDMDEILQKMQAADVIVLATPTYFLTMNGMLKTMIDRMLPKWQDMGGHDVYLIITGHDGRAGLQLVETELKRIFSHLGNDVKATIWGEKVWKKGEVLGTAAMDEAYRAGTGV